MTSAVFDRRDALTGTPVVPEPTAPMQTDDEFRATAETKRDSLTFRKDAADVLRSLKALRPGDRRNLYAWLFWNEVADLGPNAEITFGGMRIRTGANTLAGAPVEKNK